MANDPHSILWRGDDPKKPFTAKKSTVKKGPARYWAGKAPKWAGDDEEEEEADLRTFRVAKLDKQHDRVQRLARHNQGKVPGQKKVRHRPDESDASDEERRAADILGGRARVEAAVVDEDHDGPADESRGGRKRVEARVVDDNELEDELDKASIISEQSIGNVSDISEPAAGRKRVEARVVDEDDAAADGGANEEERRKYVEGAIVKGKGEDGDDGRASVKSDAQEDEDAYDPLEEACAVEEGEDEMEVVDDYVPPTAAEDASGGEHDDDEEEVRATKEAGGDDAGAAEDEEDEEEDEEMEVMEEYVPNEQEETGDGGKREKLAEVTTMKDAKESREAIEGEVSGEDGRKGEKPDIEREPMIENKDIEDEDEDAAGREKKKERGNRTEEAVVEKGDEEDEDVAAERRKERKRAEEEEEKRRKVVEEEKRREEEEERKREEEEERRREEDERRREEEEERRREEEEEGRRREEEEEEARAAQARAAAAEVNVQDVSDRLKRLQKIKIEKGASAIHLGEELGDETDSEARNDLRAAARTRALVKRKMEETKLEELKKEQASESEESESDPEESESDSDEFGRALLKPVFVPKSMRTTDVQKQALELHEKRLEEDRKQAIKLRAAESKAMVVEAIRKEEEEIKEEQAVQSDAEMPDDEDGDEAEEYELWKIRELKRVVKTAQERQARKKEAAAIERRRNMTDAERAADDRRLDALKPKEDKGQKYAFMQKYYHKGGYFMDDDGKEAILTRDVNEALAEEKYDKSSLPQVMQIRRGLWGKKGQVKHTHLSAVDTTSKESLWASSADDRNLKKKREDKSRTFDRPSAK